MNQKALNTFILRLLASIAAATISAFVIRQTLSTTINADFVSTGWLFGTFGTIYALITAFILIEVWNQYNSLESAMSQEAKVITSIWNYTDYLNDPKISRSMRLTLMAYLNKVINTEIDSMGANKLVAHPSSELSQIMRVIDSIKFDDDRDSSAFKSLIQSFENLSGARMNRLSQGSTRIPVLLKVFFDLVSMFFLIIYSLQMFISTPLYIFTVILISTVVLFVRTIIYDLDNPFAGIWNISTDSYNNAKQFITQSSHED